MTPLEITARLNGPICMPYAPIALDGLLAWAVAQRDGIEPALRTRDLVPIEIPVQREPDGRFHLASFAQYEVERREGQWTNRRPPVEHAQLLASPKVRTINIGTGPSKGFRIPREALHLRNDMLIWWCIGEREVIEDLLSLVLYLGRKRAVGLGEVAEWDVSECTTWDGFPVVRGSQPLRPLPPDWPGLVDPEIGYSCITYPYWIASEEQICAVPN